MTTLEPLWLDGSSLTLADVVTVARQGRMVALHAQARQRMLASRGYVESLLRPNSPAVYGINTGFGVFANRSIEPGASARLSRNLILSHAVGTGDPFPDEIVRAAMLVRANTLALGHSGVRPEVVETLIAMLNAGVHPIVPQQGSLGSSGDLAPLAHLALVLSCDDPDREDDSGEARLSGQQLSGQAAMRAAGIERLQLTAKEGLAITNGATFSAALAALVAHDARHLLQHALAMLALALEALQGVSHAFDARLHAARRHSGQARIAAAVRTLIAGSTFVGAAGRVQDPYSLRCAPQVLGPVLATLDMVDGWVENELNAATDNPLIFEGEAGSRQAISGGNFHGEVVGLAMDYLGIALAEVGALTERQIERMVNGNYSFGLPPMLVSNDSSAGLNSGLMMPHYTAVSLVLENQTLAHPDSVHSLPTSAGQEDHNANALTAARHAFQIMENVTQILAIGLLTAAQAIDLRSNITAGGRLAPATASAHACLRRAVPFAPVDRLFAKDIRHVRELMRSGEVLQAVEAVAGSLLAA